MVLSLNNILLKESWPCVLERTCTTLLWPRDTGGIRQVKDVLHFADFLMCFHIRMNWRNQVSARSQRE